MPEMKINDLFFIIITDRKHAKAYARRAVRFQSSIDLNIIFVNPSDNIMFPSFKLDVRFVRGSHFIISRAHEIKFYIHVDRPKDRRFCVVHQRFIPFLVH